MTDPAPLDHTRPLRKDAAANRTRILDAAGRVFSERGLAVPMDEIAAAAGVGIGTLYRRFPDRTTLIDALFEDRLGVVVTLGERALEIEDGWDALAWFLDQALRRQMEDRGLAEMFRSYDDPNGHIDAIKDRLVGLADRLVARAKASGRLRADFATTDMVLMQALITSGPLTSDFAPDLWRRQLVLYLDGMLATRDGASPQTVPALPTDRLDTVMHRLGKARTR